MVAGVGLCDARITLRIGFPIELSAIHYHSAEARAVPSDELRCGMHHDVCTMFERTDKEWSKSIIDDEDNAMPVGHLGHAFQVQNVAVWIAKGLCIEHFRLGPNGRFQRVEIIKIHDGMGNSLRCEGVRNEVVGTTVKVVGSHDMPSSLYDILQSIGDGRCSRGHGKRCHASLQSCNAVLQNALGGVRQASVDVSWVAKTETVCRVLSIVEHITCCLIDGNSTRISCWVGNLPCMQSNRLEMLFLCTHNEIYYLTIYDLRFIYYFII